MRINRMFEIIYILLDKKRVTAQQLADHFEVSRRTIYRDIENLSAAGLPIYMSKGRGGGIALLPGYTLNKAVFTDEEKTSMLTALQNFDALKVDKSANLLQKISQFFGQNTNNYIEIDPLEWGGKVNDAYLQAKQAIIGKKLFGFDYVSSDGKVTQRIVEPYLLWFKAHTWYLKAYCLTKRAQRLFRLSRIRNPQINQQSFTARELPPFEIEDHLPPLTDIVLQIDKQSARRVYDEFSESEISVNPDGSFTIKTAVLMDDWVVSNILSYGASATVIKPQSLRQTVLKQLKKATENYLNQI